MKIIAKRPPKAPAAKGSIVFRFLLLLYFTVCYYNEAYYGGASTNGKHTTTSDVRRQCTHLPSLACSSSRSDGLRFVFRVRAANMPIRFVIQHMKSIRRITSSMAPIAMPTMAPDDSIAPSTRRTTSAPKIVWPVVIVNQSRNRRR